MARKGLFNLPHDVYRVRDAAGALLYVGRSRNAYNRIDEHRDERQPWYPLAASVEIRRYANWTTAAYFEALAIKDEQPAWNVTPEAASLRKAPRIRPEPIEPDERFPIEYWNRSKT